MVLGKLVDFCSNLFVIAPMGKAPIRLLAFMELSGFGHNFAGLGSMDGNGTAAELPTLFAFFTDSDGVCGNGFGRGFECENGIKNLCVAGICGRIVFVGWSWPDDFCASEISEFLGWTGAEMEF